MDDTDRDRSRAVRLPHIRLAVVFTVVFACMQLSWQALGGTRVERFVIDEVTVRPAAFLVNTLTPQVQAQAVGASIRAPGGGINILNGCEGTEGMFLLLAAFGVARLTLVSRLRGALLGLAFVYCINQGRILALFYAYRAYRSWFDPLHAIVTPIAVVLLTAGYFYVWLDRFSPAPAATV